MTTTLATVDQPVVATDSGHFIRLPLIPGGYTATVVGSEGPDHRVRFLAVPELAEMTVLLYAADVRA